MIKNGCSLLLTICEDDLQSGKWDPFYYRDYRKNSKLSDYVQISKVSGKKYDLSGTDFEPIEYRDIPKGNFLVFSLSEKNIKDCGKYNMVKEQTLLFGTMRAYLGNLIVTPKIEWTGKEKDVLYPLNSEFVQIIPKDGLIYFWWAFLKSQSFLKLLPVGAGGTRPRTDVNTLSNLPVSVPPIFLREEINQKLMILARDSWENYFQTKLLLKDLDNFNS